MRADDVFVIDNKYLALRLLRHTSTSRLANFCRKQRGPVEQNHFQNHSGSF